MKKLYLVIAAIPIIFIFISFYQSFQLEAQIAKTSLFNYDETAYDYFDIQITEINSANKLSDFYPQVENDEESNSDHHFIQIIFNFKNNLDDSVVKFPGTNYWEDGKISGALGLPIELEQYVILGFETNELKDLSSKESFIIKMNESFKGHYILEVPNDLDVSDLGFYFDTQYVKLSSNYEDKIKTCTPLYKSNHFEIGELNFSCEKQIFY